MATVLDLSQPRLSLRERREVLLTITPISYREWNTAYDCDCELELVMIFENKTKLTPAEEEGVRFGWVLAGEYEYEEELEEEVDEDEDDEGEETQEEGGEDDYSGEDYLSLDDNLEVEEAWVDEDEGEELEDDVEEESGNEGRVPLNSPAFSLEEDNVEVAEVPVDKEVDEDEGVELEDEDGEDSCDDRAYQVPPNSPTSLLERGRAEVDEVSADGEESVDKDGGDEEELDDYDDESHPASSFSSEEDNKPEEEQVADEDKKKSEDEEYLVDDDKVHEDPPPPPTSSLEEGDAQAKGLIVDGYERVDESGDEGEGEELAYDEEDECDDEAHPCPLSPAPLLEEGSHFLAIKKRLYIALVDDETDTSALRTYDQKLFTHVVQVSYATQIGNEPLPTSWREEASRSAQVQRLDITCPAACLRLRADETAVSYSDLRAARDFLALALPYGSTEWWPEALRRCGQLRKWSEQEDRHVQHGQDVDVDVDAQTVVLAPGGPDELENEPDDPILQEDIDVHALIVAPISRAVDVVSVLYCYLAFLEDTTVWDLALEKYYGPFWEQVTLGLLCMREVNMMAKQI